MSRLIPLNPFVNIVVKLETFLQTHLDTITAMMLRPYQDKPEQRLREMNITKAVLEDDGRYVGMINIHVLNDKFLAANLKTTQQRRYPNLDNSAQEVTPEWFKQNFIDDRDHLKIQLSFKQFRTDNLAIADVTYSTRYESYVGSPDGWNAVKLTREDTALLWNDPAMVLAIRTFFDLVDPVLTGWTPHLGDITTQTVFVQ